MGDVVAAAEADTLRPGSDGDRHPVADDRYIAAAAVGEREGDAADSVWEQPGDLGGASGKAFGRYVAWRRAATDKQAVVEDLWWSGACPTSDVRLKRAPRRDADVPLIGGDPYHRARYGEASRGRRIDGKRTPHVLLKGVVWIIALRRSTERSEVLAEQHAIGTDWRGGRLWITTSADDERAHGGYAGRHNRRGDRHASATPPHADTHTVPLGMYTRSQQRERRRSGRTRDRVSVSDLL